MSGEPERNVSGWTTDTLREHFTVLLKEVDQRNEQRFKDQDSAVKAALAAAEKAVTKAEANVEKWRESQNEWRGAMNDRERDLMPRMEAEKSIAANAEKIDNLAARIDRTEGRSGGISAGWGYLVGAVGLLATVITIALLLRR